MFSSIFEKIMPGKIWMEESLCMRKQWKALQEQV